MSNPNPNPFDPRSKRGMYSRGKNIYRGGSHTPNASGKNKQQVTMQDMAKLALERMKGLKPNGR